jgi:hypothetical protein
LAAELMIWSIACMAKLKVMNSTIGFRPAEGRADAQAGEAVLGDRRIDDALGAELVQQALADLVGALILGDLLAHQEDVLVAAHSSAMASRRASRTVIILVGPSVYSGSARRRALGAAACGTGSGAFSVLLEAGIVGCRGFGPGLGRRRSSVTALLPSAIASAAEASSPSSKITAMGVLTA